MLNAQCSGFIGLILTIFNLLIFNSEGSMAQCTTFANQIGSGSGYPIVSAIPVSLYTSGGSFYTITGKNINVNGILTVDHNLRINSSNFEMGPGAIIKVLPGMILIIEQGSYLSSCQTTGDMWEGIQFDGDNQSGGSQVYINTGSKIEDAIAGVHLMDDQTSLSFLQIDGAIFNRNYRCIWFENNNFYQNSNNVIANNTFSCKLNSQNGHFLHIPHLHERTFHAIEMNHSIISTASNAPIIIGDYNSFEFMDVGIFCTRSSIRSDRNTFTNCTAGIQAEVDEFLYVYNSTFNECTTGILCPNTVQLFYAWYNQFNGNTICIDYQKGSIFYCEINHNDFLNFIAFGVHVMDNNINLQFQSTIQINNNLFSGSVYGTGIFVAEPIAAAVYGVEIKGNNMEDIARGIHTIQLLRPLIRLNTIQISYDPQIIPSPVTFGINAVSCHGARIVLNNVDCTNPDNACNGASSGIITENSNAVYINCNEVNHVGQGFSFGVQTFNNFFLQNSMGEIQHQLYLYNNASGLGAVGDNNTDMENLWLNLPTGCASDNTYSDNSNNGPSGFTKFFVANTASHIPSTNNIINGGSQCTNSIISPTITFPQCNFDWGGDNSALRNAIASDSLYNGTEYENYRWLSKQYFLNDIGRDTIINTNIFWQVQYDSILYSTIGILGKIADSISKIGMGDSTSINNYLTVLNAFSTSNYFEQNLKKVFTIYLHGKQNGLRNITLSDKDTLRSFSQRCVVTDGPAVYAAQVMLSSIDSLVQFSIGCDGAFAPGYYRSTTPEKTNDILYPNPANDIIYISEPFINQATDLKIYSLYGQLISQYAVSKNSKDSGFKICTLTSGIYFYELLNSGERFKSGKLIKY